MDRPRSSASANLITPKRTPKQRRVTQACDFCHRRSIRCRPANDGINCQNCVDFAHQCTYHRTPRRRGVQPRDTEPRAIVHPAAGQNAPALVVQQRPKAPVRTSSPAVTNEPYSLQFHPRRPGHDWVGPAVASQDVIVDLVELYFEIVYPIFPFFHQPSFTRRISRADYLSDRSLFADTMAICSLVSSRVRDGAVSNPTWDLSSILAISPDSFYVQAETQLRHLEGKSDIDTLRAHAIMSIASIQNGKPKEMHLHLGTYHTLVAMDGLHDEANWPQDIGNIEREERRRLVSTDILKLARRILAHFFPHYSTVLVHLHFGDICSCSLGWNHTLP